MLANFALRFAILPQKTKTPKHGVTVLAQSTPFFAVPLFAFLGAMVKNKFGGDLSDKPYGIGSVGFPTQKLPVAEEAVSS